MNQSSEELKMSSLTECHVNVFEEDMSRRKNPASNPLKVQNNDYRTFDSTKQRNEYVIPITLIEYEPLLVRIGRAILSNAVWRAQLYIIGSLILGYVGANISPETVKAIYTARSKNVFNEYFVKMAWAWNLGLLGPLLMINSIGGKNPFSNMFASIFRLAAATAVWYGSVRFFDDFIQPNFDGFDVSGHCFILVWGILMLIEETTKVDILQHKSPSMRLILYFLLTLCALLTCIWDTMFVSTSLFYHTAAEKLWAVMIAFTAWILLYQLIYPCVATIVTPEYQATDNNKR